MSVGKTSYILRFMKGVFATSGATIGVELESKKITLPDGQVVLSKIWDTSGHEKYKSITTAHYNQSAGALLFFDLTNISSFRDVVEWISEIKENSGEVSPPLYP